MKKRILTLALAVLLLLSVIPSAAAAETADAAAEPMAVVPVRVAIPAQEYYSKAFEVLTIVNRERAANGLQPLTMDASLLETAMLRAAEIYVYFDHTRPDGTLCFTANDRMYGENIAAGQTTPASVMQAWMNSEGHRDNILGSYTTVGIGCVLVDGRYYWTQCFGRDLSAAASAASYADGPRTREVLALYDVRFEDVDYTSWYGDAVEWAVGSGVTNGTSMNPLLFSPGAYCSRAQMVTFLWRAVVYPEPTMTASPFTDVQDGSQYYYKAVLWAVEEGITNGTSATTFSPGDTVTRAQVVTFLWRAADQPAPSTTVSPFTDIASGQYYYDAVLSAAENGITTGTSATTFSPGAPCTRAQIVTFLWRVATGG